MTIQRLEANQPPERFYLGGKNIDRFRNNQHGRPNTPEDWIASTTTLFGDDTVGLSTLPDGTLLADAVLADPIYWLGPDHVEAYGPDVMLLVKLLDAGQRLPVHVHPDRGFSASHLDRPHGKTEAWIMLSSAPVFLGWSRSIDEEQLRSWVDDQAGDTMLANMNRVEVSAGDAVLVPAGTVHSIGKGGFLVELQEPEDLSIMLEWAGFDLDGTEFGHVGLGFDLALTAADRQGLTGSELTRLVRPGALDQAGSMFPAAADEFFRADRIINRASSTEVEPGFSVVVVTGGSGTIADGNNRGQPMAAGDTLVVSHGAGVTTVDGQVEIVVCRPPRPGP